MSPFGMVIRFSWFSWKTLFLHPTDDYDFVVQLNRGVLPRYFQNINVDESVLVTKKGKYVNLPRASGDVRTSVRPGFDPARLLFEDLQVR